MIPPNGVVDNAPPGECCKVLYGEVNDEQWDKNDKEVVAGSDATHFGKMGVVITVVWWVLFPRGAKSNKPPPF